MAVETRLASETRDATSGIGRTPGELVDIVVRFASSDGWMGRVRLRDDRRWFERIYVGPDYDVWVISWLPGQSTGFHDHGSSSGAFVVTTGVLEERRPNGRAQVVRAGKPLAFGPDYTHDVGNVSLAPAISIHAYSPPLTEMNEYELDGVRLIPRNGVFREIMSIDQDLGSGKSRIEQVLEAARGRLRRLSPTDAYEAVSKAKAVLVDIRPAEQRASEGSIAGALVVERNVLEWRFDPTAASRLPIASSPDLQVILFCSEGYASSLAAVSLLDVGLWRATDVVGGFQAWRAAGLPTVPPGF
jgi:rhodanese-related sulfurtransferase/quercetin dioxygenase-like cupin family protein